MNNTTNPLTFQELVYRVTLAPVCSHGVRDLAYYINNYPNPRVRYLAHHAKKARVRKKNFNRLVEMMFGCKCAGRVVNKMISIPHYNHIEMHRGN